MSKVVAELKQIQADSIVFFVKLHNLHWNVKGMDFHPTHAATEEIYDAFSDIFDDVAERVLQLGDKPYVTLADMIKASNIKEESKSDFTSKEVLNIVKKDYEYFLKSFKNISKIADEAGDKGTAAYMDDKVAALEKSLWMIGAQLS